jgi:hypothetical protein
MWAVVLLPRWLGTSDKYRDSRSAQRFRRSLQSVSARRHRSHDVAAMPDGRSGRVDTAPADAAIDRHLDLGIDPFVGTAEDGRRRRARQQDARQQATAAAAVRRRRIVIGLGAVTALLIAGALLGVTSIAWASISTLALGGYVYLLRAQSRTRARAHAARTREGARRTAPATADTRSTWDPVPAHEPSYMRAPRATAVPREIDVDESGPWTAERMLEQAAALRAEGDADSELGLDEYAYPHEYQTARAVNE